MTVSCEPTRASIEQAFRRVHDPCSIAAGSPVNILEMGLVRDWSWHDGRLDVTMCVTSISCMMSGHFTEAAEAELLELEGIDEVQITIDAAFTWTEDEMRESARQRLAARRAEARELVRPQQWRERARPAGGGAGHAPRAGAR